MRTMRYYDLKPKIRYYKDYRDANNYCLKINKRFVMEYEISHFLRTHQDIWENMIINTYNATKGISQWGYTKYTFKTLRDAKNAINYLRSLLVMNQISQ